MSRRAYDNSLRAEQAERTRQRILSAARELLADPAGPLTFPSVAARAGVSEPTVYRHFPSRGELLTAVSESMSASLGQPPAAQRAEELPTAVAAAAMFFGRHPEWFRAAIRNPHLRDMRLSGRRVREERFRALLAPRLAHLAPRDREVFAALCFLIVRAETWDQATQSFGLSDDEVAGGFAWIVQTMLDAADALRREGATRLIDDALLDRARALFPSTTQSEPTASRPAHRAHASGPPRKPRRKVRP